MDIGNLSLNNPQSAVPGESPNLRSAISEIGSSLGANTFLQQLAHQIAEIQDPETAQAIIDQLNAELIAAANGHPNGNLLPLGMNTNTLPGKLNLSDLKTSLKLPKSDKPDSDPTLLSGLTPYAVIQAPAAVPENENQSNLESVSEFSTSEKGNIAPVPMPAANGGALEQLKPESEEIDSVATKPSEPASLPPSTMSRTEFPIAQGIHSETSTADKSNPLTLEKPIHDPQWKQELVDRVVWMTKNTLTTAELKVNPPQMGPVEVRIQMNNDQMNVLFASQSAGTREAIEASLPLLREIVGAQQLNLVNVDVSHSFPDHRQHNTSENTGGNPRYQGTESTQSDSSEETAQDASDSIQLGTSLGLLNYYV